MKKSFKLVGVALMATVFSISAYAVKPEEGKKGNGAPKGKFEKFLLVAPGNPNTVQDDLTNFLKNDNSNGRAIFIPTKTKNAPDSVYCGNADGTGSYIQGDSANANLLDSAPSNGVKLTFLKTSDGGLEIVDRDATDGEAIVNVPADWAEADSIDLYIRVLGKPGGCFMTEAYVLDGSTYYWAGSAAFKRKRGQSTFVDASELTDVWVCPDGYTAIPTTGSNYVCDLDGDSSTTDDQVDAIEVNVFAAFLEGYYWDMTNDGVRVVHVLMRANFSS